MFTCLLREGSSLIMDIVIDLQVLGFSALSRAPLLEVKASIYFWLMYNWHAVSSLAGAGYLYVQYVP